MQLMFESQLLISPSKLNQSIEWNQTLFLPNGNASRNATRQGLSEIVPYLVSIFLCRQH